jgi:hypothetical protein
VREGPVLPLSLEELQQRRGRAASADVRGGLHNCSIAYLISAAGAGFLLVPWFDLMFDMQGRARSNPLSAEVLSSIAAYCLPARHRCRDKPRTATIATKQI